MARDTKGSSLRNRIRVTHKSRLKVLRGNIDAEAAFGEDELNQQNASTAGVDAEDASEHHLQQVLHAAAQRTASSSALTRTRGTNAPPPPEAPQQFIPTPDATGLAIDYEKLYPQNKFTEPVGYIRFSDTVDECQDAGFANGFTYFLDERDCEWLEKNNQAARGEGTSTGATARPRNAKAKGKEPEPPVPITEDELELVMGVFEKVTEERYPFLHLDVGNIPDLSAFESVFSAPLPASYFASYSVPDTVPTPSHLWRLARLIYPHWRERKIERQGRRVIPQLNYDESNEGDSYVCFRRRDVKPIRKTRRTDTASVDKLLRLKGEMASAMELATSVVAREVHRREAAQEALTVWKARLKFVDLKRKYPTLGTAEDDTMLFDKERVVKRSRIESMGTIKIKGPRTSVDSISAPVEVQKHPRERAAHIQTLVEKEMSRKKEQDYLWEDVTDMPLHAFQVHVNQRHFRTPVQPETHSQPSPSPTTPDRNARPPNVRLRMGRGGRIVLDRRFIRSPVPKQTEPDLSRFLWPYPPQLPLDPAEKQRQEEEAERARRIADMWKFDRDANAEVNGEELERVIVDDFEPRYMKARISLLSETDQYAITADCTGISQLTQLDHRNPNSALSKLVAAMKQKQPPTPVSVSIPVASSTPGPPPTATPASIASTQTKLQPPTIPTPAARPAGVRLSSSPSNTTSVTAALSATPAPMLNAVNGASAKPNGTAYLTPPAHPNAIAIPPDSAPPVRVSSPMRPKSQPQQQPMTNGFPAAANGSFPAFPVNGVYHAQGPQVNGNRAQLNQQQLKSLQAAYAQHQSQGMLPLQQQQVALGQMPLPQHYTMPIPGAPMNGGPVSIANINLGLAAQNMQLKLPQRAMQRGNIALGPANMNGAATPVSPIPGHALPRAPAGVGAANGHPIATARGAPMVAAHAHHLATHSSPHLIPHSSPPHSSQTPIPIPSASPSHQQQQVVGGAGS